MRPGPAAVILVLLLAGCLGVVPVGLDGQGATPDRPRPDAAGPPVLLDGFGDAAMEPHVALRDANGKAAIVVANANRIPGAVPGNALPMSIEVHRSLDGGRTWASAPLPPAIFDAFDPLHRFSSTGDPVVAYAPDGALFLAGVATTGTSHPDVPEAEMLTDFSVFVTRSTDDGATWDPPALWQEGLGPSFGLTNDKPWLVAGADGVLHFTWTAFTGLAVTEIRYTRSVDGGLTWEAPRVIATPDLTTLSQVQGTTLAAPGGGRVYVSFTDIRNDGSGHRQLALASADGGDTFGAAQEVGSATFPRYGQVFADARDPLRAFVVVPAAGDVPLLQLSTTLDGGATWGAPALVDAARGAAQQHAAGHVLPDGTVLLGYYDAGWPDGEHFTWTCIDANGSVTSTPVGLATAPGANRREYLGVAGLGNAAWGTWVAGDEQAGTQIGVDRFRA